ncbi:MAG: hypothetical protein MZU97_06695 [Bacillus subtilis]|nr:hypothetical protein [Bacillus subtilis]
MERLGLRRRELRRMKDGNLLVNPYRFYSQPSSRTRILPEQAERPRTIRCRCREMNGKPLSPLRRRLGPQIGACTRR